jgi:hypothetical protein
LKTTPGKTNIREILENIGIGNDFLNKNPITQEIIEN